MSRVRRRRSIMSVSARKLGGECSSGLRGHSIGPARGNTFQMPGVYVYHCGQIVGGFRHDFASDRPDYIGLVSGVVTSEQLQPMTVV